VAAPGQKNTRSDSKYTCSPARVRATSVIESQ
jgi:hypothetical protein